MRFTIAAATIALASLVAAQNATLGMATPSDVYVTEVVTEYTTYCPEATTITNNGQTYTVSEATLLTVTNCPGGCTVTKPVSAAAVPATAAPIAPVAATSVAAVSGAPYPSVNGTNPAAPIGSGTAAASGTGSAASGTSKPLPTYTGAATKAAVGAGALLLGLVAAL